MIWQVKNKMTKPGFLRNNQGIDDGQDLPEPYMSALYDRIVNDEIKMKVGCLAEAVGQLPSGLCMQVESHKSCAPS